MPTPVERVGSAYWTPLEWSIKKLTEQGVEEIEFDADTPALTVKPGKAKWRGIDVQSENERTVVLSLQLPPGPVVSTFTSDTTFAVQESGAKVADSNFSVNLPSSMGRVKKDFSLDPPQVLFVFTRKIQSITRSS